MTAPPSAEPRRIDPGNLLALSSIEARAIAALFIVTNAAFAWGTAGFVARPWQTTLAVTIVGLGGMLIVAKRPYPFLWRDTVVILGAVVVSNALVFDSLQAPGDLGRATWNLGSNTWLLFFLTIRGRPIAAWSGMAVMLVQTGVWAATTDRGAAAGLSMCANHVGMLLVGTLFANLLRSTAARIAALRERSLTAAADTAAADAGLEIRRARARELAELAVPLLERIAAGGDYSDEERAAFARAEARLRDGVRGRALALPDVVEATEDARIRGVQVTILDDRREPIADGDALGRMVGEIVHALTTAQAGSVTVRLQPEGRDAALTILSADHDAISRVVLDAEGEPLTAAGPQR